MKIVIAGGGTGGHIFPGMAIAEEFLSRGSGNDVLMIGAEGGIEENFWMEQNMKFRLIKNGKFAGEPLLVKLRSLGKVMVGTFQAISILREYKPEFILGMGGYVAFPAIVAGFLLRIPRGIHEQNSYPGLANRLMSRISDVVFLSFEEARVYFKGLRDEQFILSGNPLRRKVMAQLQRGDEEVEEKNSRFQVLVIGGSQGARRLNKLLIDSCEYLAEVRDRIKIVHMSGKLDQYDLIRAYSRCWIRAKVYQFIDDIGKELREADLVISRAGAGAIFEIALAGKPSILIPYPYAANNHQMTNARYLSEKGAALVFSEDELKPKGFADAIIELLNQPEKRAEMGKKARSLAMPEAGKIIVDEIYRRAGEMR